MRALLIATTYRVGEKIYPILEPLSKLCDVDVLYLYQMSPHTQWVGNFDSRQIFYKQCRLFCLNEFKGPVFVKDNDENAKIYSTFVQSLGKVFRDHMYELVIVDNNIPITGGQFNEIYKFFKRRKSIVVACPHGNREYRGYKVLKRIGGYYDYSFVFGKKEEKGLARKDKKHADNRNYLLPGGIPSNDTLKNCKRGNKYILVIPNFTDKKHIGGQTAKFTAFTKETFDALGLRKLSSVYDLDILIKEKNKIFYPTTALRDSLKSCKRVKFVLDCEDENQLIANAKCVISAPSTMAFKPIQIGIPTVMLSGHGMIGNFYDFPGLIKQHDFKKMWESLTEQDKMGKCESFIEDTLAGGLSFSSTGCYIDEIKKLLERGNNG